MDIDWTRAAPNPKTLLILPWPHKGATVALRGESGAIHGCRDVPYGTHFNTILSAWITDARKRGLGVEISARRALHPAKG